MHFGTAIDFINDVKSRNGKVLVHCKAGVSRSATLCLAYLISCRKMCLNDAYDQVKVNIYKIYITINIKYFSVKTAGDFTKFQFHGSTPLVAGRTVGNSIRLSTAHNFLLGPK